jgi:hypothetical protein
MKKKEKRLRIHYFAVWSMNFVRSLSHPVMSKLTGLAWLGCSPLLLFSNQCNQAKILQHTPRGLLGAQRDIELIGLS